MRRFVNTSTGLFSIPGSAPLFFFFQILELMGAFLFSASSVCLTFRLPIQNKNFKLDAYLQYFDPNEGRCVPRDHIGRILALLFLIIFIFYLLSVDEWRLMDCCFIWKRLEKKLFFMLQMILMLEVNFLRRWDLLVRNDDWCP